MTSRLQHILATSLRLIIVAASCWGIWLSWRLSRADFLFHQDTETSIRQAISVAPDAWAYYMRLAEFDPVHAQQLLTTAVHLNPYDAQAEIELGLQEEALGEFGKSEQSFKRAFAVDHTYLPRWSLASFYFRRGNTAAFWTWARSAAEMPSDNMGALFELCWRVSPDATEITRQIVNDNPKLLRQYLDFLLSRNQASSAAEIAIRLIRYGDPNTDLPQMFSAINQLLTLKDGNPAKATWTALVAKRWVVADRELPNNPNFARDPLPVQFDWTLPSNSGVESVPGPSGLETEFSGLESDQCEIAEQAVVLVPGDYELNFSYRTQGIAPGTGVQWQIVGEDSTKPLAESSDLSSESLARAKMRFSIPPGTSLVHLRLIYQRALGTTPISGTLVISSVQIQPHR